MAEPAFPRQALAAVERTDGRAVVAVAGVVVLVAAAFVAGWRARGGLGRLTGYR